MMLGPHPRRVETRNLRGGVSFQRRPAMPFGGSCVTHQWQRGREPRLNAFAQIAWRGFPSVGALPNSTLLPANAEAIRDTPVMLPLGRAKLGTMPVSTGSPAIMTIGISR